MRRTPEFIKVVLCVSYTNSEGIEHEIAQFQLATARNLDHCKRRLDQFVQHGETSLPEPIRDYLAALRSHEYDLHLHTYLEA